MPPRVAAEGKPRRRRRPEDAEREILEAADALLRERPLHAVTVDEIMRRTTLSRKSFYVYFHDRYELLRRLVAPLRKELDRANAHALERDDGRATFMAVATILRDDGMLLRALSEAAHYDAQAERLWRSFNEPVIARFAARIHADVSRGSGPPSSPSPEELARALVGMNLYSFFDRVVGHPDVDLEAVIEPLYQVWMRALAPPRAGEPGP